jgi:hypothetical protein
MKGTTVCATRSAPISSVAMKIALIYNDVI